MAGFSVSGINWFLHRTRKLDTVLERAFQAIRQVKEHSIGSVNSAKM